QYYASFVGAVPARDPRVVIMVSVDNPEGGHFGNEVAAPSFSRLGAQIMAHLGVPPDDPEAGDEPPTPVVVRAASDDASDADDGGEGPPDGVEPALPGSRRRPKLTTGLPDFTGMSLARAIDAAERARVTLRAEGTGVAVLQDTQPGPVDEGAVVRVYFEPPE
ncbi:MAG: hypothetical protein KC636_14360, partial [Myxococcales bacterium]|nr:hypothetical protein [Myxococcales bacterium]